MSEQTGFFSESSTSAKIGLIAGVVFIFFVAAGLYFWANRVPYENLLTEAGEEDLARAVQELYSRNIPFRISEDGLNLEVTQENSARARMALADLGLPFDSTVGLEMFETSDFGVTEFAQRINYKRALEGELTRTISAMHEVRYARVHLVLPEKALLKSNAIEPSAAITLFLRKDTVLTTVQIEGIQSLVVASVPRLEKTAVIILNQSGQRLTANVKDKNAASYSLSSSLEQDLQFKVENLLSQRFFADQFRVTVSAEVENKDIHRVEERPVGVKSSEGAVTRRVSSKDYSANDSKPTTKVEEVFEYGRVREEVNVQAGSISRLSIAVWITAAISSEEQEKIEEILKASVGADMSRGDRVVVLVSDKESIDIRDQSTSEDVDSPPARKVDSQPINKPMIGAHLVHFSKLLPLWFKIAFVAFILMFITLIGVVFVLIQRLNASRLTQGQREALLDNLQSLVSSK